MLPGPGETGLKLFPAFKHIWIPVQVIFYGQRYTKYSWCLPGGLAHSTYVVDAVCQIRGDRIEVGNLLGMYQRYQRLLITKELSE